MVAAKGGRWGDLAAMPQGTQIKVVPNTPSMLLRWLLQHGPLRALMVTAFESIMGECLDVWGVSCVGRKLCECANMIVNDAGIL